MSVLDSIGNTELRYLTSYANGRLFAKIEYTNAGGSIKDRAALYMVKDLLDKVNSDTILVEPTSGNTGIALALIAREYGIKVIIIMPDNMSRERIELIESYGGEVILSDRKLGMSGAIEKAKSMKKNNSNIIIPSQFDNPANVRAHYETTAKEIFECQPNTKWVVCPVGSGGTITGIKKYIIDNGLDAKVIAVEPATSAVLSGGEKGTHSIAGIGAGFIPSILDVSIIDKIITVNDNEAVDNARELYALYDIKGGYSSGAAYAAAKKLSSYERGDIVFIVPDTGTRYISQGLFNE